MTIEYPREVKPGVYHSRIVADTLEKVCVEPVEAGYMTKDLALLVGADQRWLSTTGFLDKVAENLTKAMAA